MDSKNPIKMRHNLLIGTCQKGHAQSTQELMAQIMENTPEESREALAEKLWNMAQTMSEEEFVKSLRKM